MAFDCLRVSHFEMTQEWLLLEFFAAFSRFVLEIYGYSKAVNA